MRTLSRFLVLLLLWIPAAVWASGQCDVKSQQDMAITMNIDSYDPSTPYNLTFQKTGGNKEKVLIWSTSNAYSPLIYENTLVEGKNYNIRVSYTDNTHTFTYYRKEKESSTWEEVGSVQKDLDNGNADLELVGDAELICQFDQDVPDTPTELPDICEVVPGTLQTNFYTNDGKPYGNLATTPGVGSKIYLPSDDSVMSFGSTTSTDCYYPSAGGPIACKVDSNKIISGYPLVLEDKFSTQNLTIPANTVVTLEGGEYWFNSISFGGSGSTLNVNDKTVIHYKSVVIPNSPSGNVFINNEGDSKDLLFIGHGSNASWTTTSSSPSLFVKAHFYIDNATSQGFSLGGSNSVIYGGVTANAISLGGSSNTINGNGGCGGDDVEPEPKPLDLCEYFPSALQGNSYSGSQVTSALNLIQGNGDLANRVYLDNQAPLSFASTSAHIEPDGSGVSNSGCVYPSADGSFSRDIHAPVKCLIDPSLNEFPNGAPIPQDFNVEGPALTIDDNAVTSGENHLTPGNYTSINVTANNYGTVYFSAGEYWIGELRLSTNQSSIMTEGDGQVIIHYKKLAASSSNHYINTSTERTDYSDLTPSEFEISDTYKPENLVLIGHGADSGIPSGQQVQDTYINALWYISPEATSGLTIQNSPRFQFIGALSAPKVELSSGNDHAYIYGYSDFNCSTTPSETYNIQVTPDDAYALTCDAPDITFTVTDENGNTVTDYTGNIKATFPTDLTPDNAGIKQGSVVDDSNNIYKPASGQVIVPVSSNKYQKYTVTGDLVDDNASDTGSIEFVPFAFYADEQHVIANKPLNVTVKALACDSETHDKVAANYTGKPTVGFTMNAPTNGVGDLSFAPEFSESDSGSTNTDLTFTDSGKLTVTLKDENFDCTGLEGCPIGEDGETDGVLQGAFTVYSRPWTFAICDAGGTAMDGNISNAATQAFKAAGEAFSLYVKPLRWVSGNTDPILGEEEVDVSDYCNNSITQNFPSAQTPTVTIQLDHELAQPAEEEGGNAGSLSGVLSLTNLDNQSSGSSAYYNFDALAWSEVGVMRMTVDTAENYYDMNINMGYRNIGRFYPHHFRLDNANTWNYAAGHSGFAYMNQPISMDYTVKAKNLQDEDTQNYGYFSDDLLASFNIEARAGSGVFGVLVVDGDSLNGRICSDYSSDVLIDDECKVNENNWNKASYEFSSDHFIFLKQQESAAEYTSSPDGPYNEDNAEFGVSVDVSNGTYKNDDDVNFDSEFTSNGTFNAVDGLGGLAVSFFNQPDFRYGRMALGNVSGPIGGPISVPLRIEYWNGNSFVTNTDDSGSEFKANVYYVQSNVTGSSAQLSSNSPSSLQKVSAGKSSVLRAQQVSSQRETVRLFLRQGNSDSVGGYGNNAEPVEDDELKATNEGWSIEEDIEQPWLQYNWRNKGDEDPSTVVTFGSYRGNDRIIYRGEPHMMN